MRNIKTTFTGVLICLLCFAGIATAQNNQRYEGVGRVNAGTMIIVRTNENISSANADGRVFTGVVDQDVTERDGDIVIPRGSPAELLVRRISNNELALDLDSVMINGERYALDTEDAVVSSNQNRGLGANERTGEFVGGGAILGAIVGAIAGGGKGAAIGAGAGAAAGAGAQVLTRGRRVSVPAESLLTFQLSRPLRAGVEDHGYMRGGVHYHNGDTAAYRDGWQAGRNDYDRNAPRNLNTRRWLSRQDRQDYEAGYNDGYQYHGAYNTGRQKPSYYNDADRSVSVSIGTDKNIRWNGPENSTVYVQVDNRAPQLFASGQSGVQSAPWISRGHLYTFVVRDAYGNEIARDQQDLRYRR
jgi:hypothetical protein